MGIRPNVLVKSIEMSKLKSDNVHCHKDACEVRDMCAIVTGHLTLLDNPWAISAKRQQEWQRCYL